MTIKAITKDETARRDFKVDGKRVKVVHTVRPDRDSDNRFNLTWTLDFGKVSDADVLELAARTITIRLQADWRKAKNKMDEKVWDHTGFDVAAILAEARQTADPLTKATRQIEKMSADEKAALLKLLQGQK